MMSVESLLAELDRRPVALDGGLGTLLEANGHDLSSSLWSARLLADQPYEITRAHREFVEAGARIVLSASYQSSFEGYAAYGMDEQQAAALMRSSVDLARDAQRDGVWVAGSVGPYGAMLADGSEYEGHYGLTVEQLRQWHRPRIAALASAGADLLAAETIPCLAEIEAIAAELTAADAPGWISVTVHDGALRSGESLHEAFRMAAASPAVVAVGINCSHPSEVLGALRAAQAVTDLPLVAYPNSGEEWDAKNRRWLGSPGFPDWLVEDWLSAGARIVGGCCRVGPAQIQGIAATLDRLRRGSRDGPGGPPRPTRSTEGSAS